MRILLVVLALGASAAVAQVPADSLDAAPRTAPRAELVLGGLAGSFVLAQVGNTIGGAVSEPAEAWATLLAIPAGAALGVIGVGHLRGADGSASGAVRGAARGTLFAAVLVPVAAVAIGPRFPLGMTESEEFLFFAALTAAAVLPTVYAVRGYTAVPVRLRAPDGASAPGVALRVAL